MTRVLSIFISALLLLHVCYQAAGQGLPKLIPYKTKNGWGYSDSNGVIKIKPQYYEAGVFVDGRAIVAMYDDSCNYSCDYKCLIDQLGQFIIPPSYHWNGLYSNTLRDQRLNVHDRNNKWGIVNSDGKLIIPFMYDDKRDPNYGFSDPLENGQWFLVVYKNGKVGVIDTLNNVLVPFSYTRLEALSGFGKFGPTFIAVRDSFKGIVRLGGKELIPVKYRYVQFVNNTPYVIAQEMGKDGKTGAVDTFGNIIVPFKYNEVYYDHSFLGNIFQIRTSKGYGCYDPKKKKMVIPDVYDALIGYSGYIVGEQFQNQNTITVIDGTILRTKSHGTISLFTLMNKKGKVLIPPKYNMISVHEDSIVIWRDEKYENSLDGNTHSFYQAALDKRTLDPISDWHFVSATSRYNGPRCGGTNFGNNYQLPEPHLDSNSTFIYSYFKDGRQWKVMRYIAIDSTSVYHGYILDPRTSYIAVETEDKGEKLYAVIKNDKSYIFKPQLRYEFVKGSYNANLFIVKQGDKYAVIDSQFKYIIPPVKAKLTEFFWWKDKVYVFGLSCPDHGNDIKDGHTRCCDRTYTSLFNDKGQAIKGFEKYERYKFFDKELTGNPIPSSNILQTWDDSDKVVFINLDGKTVFPEISSKYNLVTYHGNNYFLCGNRKTWMGGDIDYKLVDSFNKEYVPGMKVKGFSKFQLNMRGQPIVKTGMEDLYKVTYKVGRDQKTVFINSQGKVFADIDVLVEK